MRVISRCANRAIEIADWGAGIHLDPASSVLVEEVIAGATIGHKPLTYGAISGYEAHTEDRPLALVRIDAASRVCQYLQRLLSRGFRRSGSAVLASGDQLLPAVYTGLDNVGDFFFSR